ncbi:hypothetical protein [Dyella sp.]|uniref:hypothetical protein n=1 Tax=Dyella sp. TaxID=1869338 RepID=UPI002D7832B6|nr:hypothetical protein [Dyella sp.]HET6431720.1 hypothetical protein [Dyella sp.]
MPAARWWRRWAPYLGWLVLLAMLPWWLGLPLLLAGAAVLLIGVERLQDVAGTVRLGLRWGLPGVVLALKRWLGDDALAWTIAAVAALVGFTLLAGLESWLDRGLRRAAAQEDATATGTAEWPELALAPLRAGAAIVELQPVHWQAIAEAPDRTLADPAGGVVRYRSEPGGFAGYLFDPHHGLHGGRIEAPLGRCSFSPGGRWFALEARPGVLLWDRERDVVHRLRRRRLSGWHAEQPWLQGAGADMPRPLRQAGDRPTGR